MQFNHYISSCVWAWKHSKTFFNHLPIIMLIEQRDSLLSHVLVP